MLAVSEDLIFLVYREVKNALTAVAVRTITGNTAYISTGFCIYSTPISSPIVLKIGSKQSFVMGIPKSSARSTAAATAIKNLKVYCPYIFAFLMPMAFIRAISACSFAIKERAISTVISAAKITVRTADIFLTASMASPTPVLSFTVSPAVLALESLG